MDLNTQLIRYENGELDWDEYIELFQRLVDTGMVNYLQGHYGRTARDLMNGGYIIDRDAQNFVGDIVR